MLNIREHFGAGNGNPAQDYAAFQSASAVLKAAGGGALYIPTGRYYWAAGGVGFSGPTRIFGDGLSSVIVGVGSGGNSSRQLDISSELGTAILAGTGPLAAGPLSLTLASVAGLSVGQTVYLYLGGDPLDGVAPWLGMFNRISAISGNVVSFCDPCPESILDPAPIGKVHKVFPLLFLADGVEVAHLAFERDLSSGNKGYNVLSCQNARNVNFHDLHFKDSGFACVMPMYSENVTIERVWADRSIYDGSWSTASGGFLGGWHNKNLVIKQCEGHDIGGIAISFEAQNRGITIEDVRISANQGGVAFAAMMSFQPTPHGVTVRNVQLSSSTPRDAITGAVDRIENLTLNGATLTCPLYSVDGTISYDGRRSGLLRSFVKEFSLLPNMGGEPFAIPAGWYRSVRAYVSSTVGVGQWGLTAHGGSGANKASQLVAGKTVELSGFTTINPPGAFNYNPGSDFRKFFSLGTGPDVPTGATARLEIDYWPVAP